MKDYFKKVIAEYREQIEKSESADEVRALSAYYGLENVVFGN